MFKYYIKVDPRGKQLEIFWINSYYFYSTLVLNLCTDVFKLTESSLNTTVQLKQHSASIAVMTLLFLHMCTNTD